MIEKKASSSDTKIQAPYAQHSALAFPASAQTAKRFFPQLRKKKKSKNNELEIMALTSKICYAPT